MAQNDDKKEKLVSFLDQKAFDPILNTSEDKYSSDSDKTKFRDVKRSTESEKRRFHDHYQSAQEVKNNYLSDLNSETAKKKNAELRDLGLPRLPQFRDDFLDLCDRLGV